MKVPVYVVLCDDHETGDASPIAISLRQDVCEVIMREAIEGLAIQLPFMQDDSADKADRYIKTMRMVDAELEFFDDEDA